MQSFHRPYLRLLGRQSSAQDNLGAILAASEAGFSRISVDLMYGISEDMSAWRADVLTTLQLPITHISAYSLTLEPHTALSYSATKGLYRAVDDDIAADQLDVLVAAAEEGGVCAV